MMDVEAAASVLVSKTLDRLGYSQEMVRFRQQVWERVQPTAVGSKREGLSRLFESDADILSRASDIICTSRIHSLYNNSTHLTILKMDRDGTYPGYTRLICVKIATRTNCFLDEALTQPINGNIFLSSDSWRGCDRFRDSLYLREEPTQGPSNPFTCLYTGNHIDAVVAIVCDCPDILQSWLNRVRKHSWPSDEIIEEISKSEAYVVPVGFKGSPTQFLEWRICFTKAETKLIQSLNDCQVKLLILLKMIAKNSLKPVCKEITSYVMKNIVLWIAELHLPEVFTEKNLFTILKASLRFLRQCLIRRYLPSYMIPERNLLVYFSAQTNRAGHPARTNVCDVIDTMLNEGPHMLLRCEKIRTAWKVWYSFPERFYLFSNTCIKYEIISMLEGLAYAENIDSGTVQQLYESKHAIMSHFFQRLLYMGTDVFLEVNRKYEGPKTFLS